MSKTVKEHFEECRSVSDVIDSANALLTKTQKELATARETLEVIRPYLHPLHREKSYRAKNLCGREEATPAEIVEAEVARINALLGDRA